MEDNPKLNFQDLLQNLTHDRSDHLVVAGLGHRTRGKKLLYDHTKWNETKEKVIYDHFDPTFGQCFTIDISPLIGKAGPNDLENKLSLTLVLKEFQNNSKYLVYLHNESDIFALNENMPMIPYGGKKFGGYKVAIEKTVIDSLPTKNYACSRTYYQTCLKNTLAKDLRTKYNCYIPILSYDQNTEVCTNKIILQTIKTWIYHLESKSDYKDCKDLKPCEEIMYKIADKQKNDNDWKLNIYFSNKLVTFVTDSYIYTIRSLFADLGGVIGMLLGLSVFGLFETVLDKIQQYGWKITYLKNSVLGKKRNLKSSGQERAVITEQKEKEKNYEEFKILAELKGLQEKIRELESRISKD